MRNLLFLSGAGGAAEFWRPVADRLPPDWSRTLLGWPGAGDEAHDPGVESLDDLVARVAEQIAGHADLIAHSMGGVVAITLALRHPEKVRRLVLVATSGGIDISAFGGQDWRPAYRADFPAAARWITELTVDHSERLGELDAPTLLIWGDCDPISPIAVGQRLAELLPRAELTVIAGGTHAVAREQPDAVAGAIYAHLA